MTHKHLAAGALAAALLTGLPAGAAASTGPDPLLGNGLGRLTAPQPHVAKRFAGGFRLDQEKLTIRDAQGRVLIDLTPQAGTDRAAFLVAAEALGLSVSTVDPVHGTLEGYAPLAAMHALATLPGAGTLTQAIRPGVSAAPKDPRGAVVSAGVPMHRVDRVQAAGKDGKGITVGAISDSYDVASVDADGGELKDHAAQDVASGDLPGPGNPANPQPVVNLVDADPETNPTDEGRGMLQLVHDVAPAAKLCFASGNFGVLDFADSIRALADKSGPCGADIVTDDLTYYDEAVFSDGPIGAAIDEVSKKGVHYFSAAGNDGEDGAWDGRVALTAPAKAVPASKLDFSGVDPDLYSGGLQDMDPGSGTDYTQSVDLGPDGGLLDLQWDDPVDLDGATVGPSLFHATGKLNSPSAAPSFKFKATSAQVGKTLRFTADGVPSGSVDLILSVDDPSGENLGTIDTGSSPEFLATKIKRAGTYTVTVTGFGGAQGPFTVDVNDVVSPSRTTSDFNLLLFDGGGSFLGAIADRNDITGKPYEVGSPAGVDHLQVVVARGGTGSFGATRLRLLATAGATLGEHADPLAPTIFGHAMAKGATAVAAHDPYRTYLPESFTSPGGDLPMVFDAAGKRFAKPEIRRVPQIAAADGGNTTFFYSDSINDDDDLPNFYGTSAAAPHAAGIAALALQAAGGPRSISPSALRTRMEQSTYAHDLDPAHAEGTAGGLTISADGGQTDEGGVEPDAVSDPRFFKLTYTGAVPLRTLKLYGEYASPTAPGVRKPGQSDGIVFDTRPFTPDSLLTGGFPFTIGATSGGLAKSDVADTYEVPGGGQAVKGQFRHLKLTFAGGLKKGAGLQFGIDRDQARSPYGAALGNSADELGGATFLPERTGRADGLQFWAQRTDGSTFWGTVKNKLGAGFSPVDGYGVVDAEQLVLGK